MPACWATCPSAAASAFAIAVRELVVMGRYRHHGLLSAYAPADYALADAALARVGMAHLATRNFTELSGGEQQLVWLAQLSLQDAQVYLLDEPTQQLDVYYRRQVFSLVHDWATAGAENRALQHPRPRQPARTDRLPAEPVGARAAAAPALGATVREARAGWSRPHWELRVKRAE